MYASRGVSGAGAHGATPPLFVLLPTHRISETCGAQRGARDVDGEGPRVRPAGAVGHADRHDAVAIRRHELAARPDPEGARPHVGDLARRLAGRVAPAGGDLPTL